MFKGTMCERVFLAPLGNGPPTDPNTEAKRLSESINVAHEERGL